MSKGSLNKVMLIARLGQDPELRYTQSGKSVCNFSVATDSSYKDQSGKVVDQTEWSNIVIWGKLAEICGKYLKKGSKGYLEGKLNTSSYEKDGNKVYKTEIVCHEMTMLDEKSGAKPQQAKEVPKPEPSFDVPNTDFEEDDLPF